MSSMKDIQKKNDQELVSYVEEKREEVRAFRFGVAGSATRNVRQVRTAKKEIARALTEQRTRTNKQAAN